VEHTLNFPERATGKNNPGSSPRPTTGNRANPSHRSTVDAAMQKFFLSNKQQS
jgi:hypothetical protein